MSGTRGTARGTRLSIRALGAISLLALCAVLLPVTRVQADSPHPPSAHPPRSSQFDPGYIISDDSFYNPYALSERGIQAFLSSRSCLPRDASPCLADYRQTTTTQPAERGHCARYRGEANERASAIIAKVARACTVSPEVLLVLLQKEQSLLTRPSTSGYLHATGYGCPDSAACDTKYFGFFNQVYNAAWQFREYGYSPGWRYHIGPVRVQFAPGPSCGSAVVDIRNQATANLYNYTPYQPNAVTTADPEAPGTACSAYGNLNFYRIYAAWFGDPIFTRGYGLWAPCLVYQRGVSCRAIQNALQPLQP